MNGEQCKAYTLDRVLCRFIIRIQIPVDTTPSPRNDKKIYVGNFQLKFFFSIISIVGSGQNKSRKEIDTFDGQTPNHLLQSLDLFTVGHVIQMAEGENTMSGDCALAIQIRNTDLNVILRFEQRAQVLRCDTANDWMPTTWQFFSSIYIPIFRTIERERCV